MRLEVFDSPEKIIAGGSYIQPDMMIHQEANHGRIFRRRNPMLHFVQFKALYCATHIVCRSPFTDMRFQSESFRFCPPIDGLEILNWLRQLISIQIDRIKRFTSPEMRQAIFQICDITMTRQTDLKAQLYIRSDLLMCRFKCCHKFFDIPMKKTTQAPNIFTDFQNRNAVFLCLQERSPYQQSAAFGLFKPIPQVSRIPGMHLVHGTDRALDWLNILSGALKQKPPVSA